MLYLTIVSVGQVISVNLLPTGSNNGIWQKQHSAYRKPPPTEKDPESVAEECTAEVVKGKHNSTVEFWEFEGFELR